MTENTTVNKEVKDENEASNFIDITKPVLKLTEDELTKFHEFTNSINVGVGQIGDTELHIIERTEIKKALVEQVRKLVKERNELIQTFSEKYGTGQINIETGEITPV